MLRRPRPSTVGLGFALALWLLATPVQGQTRLYLAEYAFNNPKLKTMLLDGSALQELTAPPATDWLLVGLDFDPAAAKLFWSHVSTPGLIRKANADGSNPQLLVSNLKLPRGLALDTSNGWMYWGEAPPQGNAMGLVRRARLDGSGLQTVFTLIPYDPSFSYVGKPCVDPVNGYVYFCAANEIRRVRLDGTGPVQVVVRGVNTVTAVALDVANDRIYFLDANTNSDVFASARLNDNDFRVHFDNTPAFFTTSGLFDLQLELAAGRAYFTDELAKTIRRCNLDGSGLETIYTGPSTHYPTGLTMDADPPQPMQDCNENGVRDLDDLESGFSQDCNGNGIPDECEVDPCVPVIYELDHGSSPEPSGRTLSGNPSTGFEVFQPFDIVTLPEVPGVTVERIGLDGWTVNYAPAGFRATIFPDNGSGFPDESRPLAWADFQYRFSPNTVAWEYRGISAFLPAGRYYVRLTASTPSYEALVNVGVSGLPSFSRRNSNGSIVPSSYSIALRLKLAGSSSVPAGEPPPWISLLPPAPNPASGGTWIRWSQAEPRRARLDICDPAGRLVRSWPERSSPAGTSSVYWDGKDLCGRACRCGVYLVRLSTARTAGPAEVATERLLLLR